MENCSICGEGCGEKVYWGRGMGSEPLCEKCYIKHERGYARAEQKAKRKEAKK